MTRVYAMYTNDGGEEMLSLHNTLEECHNELTNAYLIETAGKTDAQLDEAFAEKGVKVYIRSMPLP